MDKRVACRTFPLRVEDPIHDRIDDALARSILKSKHQWIEKAIEEKLARDNQAV